MLLLPLKGLAERFQELEEPEFIRRRREENISLPAHTEWKSGEMPEPEFYIRSWDARPCNMSFHNLTQILRDIETNGRRHVAKSISAELKRRNVRDLSISIGFKAKDGISQWLELELNQNYQGINGTEDQILVVCHYPWSHRRVYEDEALPTLMLLRKVVEILQPDYGWHGTWESVCEQWQLDDTDTEEPATPLTHHPAPWQTYRSACVFGPSLQGMLNMQHVTGHRYGNIFTAWRDGTMLWFRSPSGFDLTYGAHSVQLNDPAGTWWMLPAPGHLQTLGNINDLFDEREERHKQTMIELISGSARRATN